MRRISLRFALLVAAASLPFGVIAGVASAAPSVGSGSLQDAGARSLPLHLDKGTVGFVAGEHDASDWLTVAAPRRGSSHRSPLAGPIPPALAALLAFFAFARRPRARSHLAHLRAARHSARAPPFATLT